MNETCIIKNQEDWPFLIDREHAEIDIDSFKQKDKPGFTLLDYCNDCEIITCRVGDSYIFGVFETEFYVLPACPPRRIRKRLAVTGEFNLLQDAVQYHYDYLESLKRRINVNQ